ncbi:IS1595 family transposase [Desulfobacterota bacterium AH_259_B03_O07]|nr:IS1595 family transposase [Desulfobacterota bacterium AH_259_B03_O07]
MTVKNRYKKHAKISEAKFKKILKLFCVDLTAVQIAEIIGLNRNTVNKYLKLIRQQIAAICESESPFSGEVEVDESFFGEKRVKGKRGRGASGKTIVFGIFKRNGSVYTEIVPDCSKPTLQGIIRGKVGLDTVIHSDSWRGYNGLVDLGYKKHLRVDHGNDEFVSKGSHINGIEGFWGYAKMRLARFRGMNKSTFYLHMKECEFRYNYRNKNIYKILLEYFKIY